MQITENIQGEEMLEVNGKRILLNVDNWQGKATKWAEQNQQRVERLLQEHGAIIIRGLNIMSSGQFGKVITSLFDAPLMSYTYRSTPRTSLRSNVYTATEYHSDEVIAQHNENAYSNKWPMRLGFFCLVPPTEGGETPITDSRTIYQMIDREVREEFEAKKIKYVRNYGDIDLHWHQVFQTEDKVEVESYCRQNDIGFEWLEDNRLRTWQVNEATQQHPITGDKVWFNQAHLFHISALKEELRNNMVSAVGVENVPRNAYFGDGSEIPVDILKHIGQLYEKQQFSFTWQKQDLMLLDNMLYTHGRNPFSGERQILVGMARPN